MDPKRFAQLHEEEVNKLRQEGFFDRVMAKASGKASKLASYGKNIGTVFKAVTQGQGGVLQNPNAVKAIKTGVRRLQSYEKGLSKLFVDLMNDMELMFGDNFQNAPANLQQAFQKLDKDSVVFITDLSNMIKAAEKSLTEPPTAPPTSQGNPQDQAPTDNLSVQQPPPKKARTMEEFSQLRESIFRRVKESK